MNEIEFLIEAPLEQRLFDLSGQVMSEDQGDALCRYVLSLPPIFEDRE